MKNIFCIPLGEKVRPIELAANGFEICLTEMYFTPLKLEVNNGFLEFNSPFYLEKITIPYKDNFQLLSKESVQKYILKNEYKRRQKISNENIFLNKIHNIILPEPSLIIELQGDDDININDQMQENVVSDINNKMSEFPFVLEGKIKIPPNMIVKLKTDQTTKTYPFIDKFEEYEIQYIKNNDKYYGIKLIVNEHYEYFINYHYIQKLDEKTIWKTFSQSWIFINIKYIHHFRIVITDSSRIEFKTKGQAICVIKKL